MMANQGVGASNLVGNPLGNQLMLGLFNRGTPKKMVSPLGEVLLRSKSLYFAFQVGLKPI